jgi:hypothetical protein
MNDPIQKNKQYFEKRVSEIVENMTLFHDDLMSKVFTHNIAATELLLRIILEREIKVIEVAGQKELKSPLVTGRMIKLDILAQDSTGRYINVEVQRNNEGSHFRRARFHHSMLDARMLEKNQKFKELADAYVIFITEKDVIGQALPLYHVTRKIEETGQDFADGSHIIYVNGAYQGDHPIGKLVHDMKCKHADEMFYKELADGVSHFKEEGGNGKMCREVEEYGNERAEIATSEAELALITNLMHKTNLTVTEAMDMLDIPQDHREKLMAHFNASK